MCLGYNQGMNLFLASSMSDVAVSILNQVSSLTKKKKLIFIPTASEPETGENDWVEDDRVSLATHAGFDVSIYSITGKTPLQIEEKFRDAGVICVNGGNNYYLMKQVRSSGFDIIVKKLVKSGLIYLGSSAGSMIAGPSIETDLDDRSVVPGMTDFSGLQLTDVSVRPHWGSPYFSEHYEKEMALLQQAAFKTILLNDSQYLHVQDDWYQIVTVK